MYIYIHAAAACKDTDRYASEASSNGATQGGDCGAQFSRNLAQFPQFLPNFGQNRNFSANPAIFSAIFPIFGKFSAIFSAILENSPKAQGEFLESAILVGVSKNSQNVKPKIFLQS